MTIYNFNKTSVHYSERGSGTPVLALHSSASTGAQWKNLADHMERRHRVITPDLPGYGRTTAWTGNGVASVESEARRIAAILHAFKPLP